MTRTFVFLAAVLGLLTIAGCGDVSAGGPSPQSASLEPAPPPPQDHGAKPRPPSLYPAGNSGTLELSNFSVKRADRSAVHFDLDYSFVQGTPNPAWTYAVVVTESRANDHITDTWLAPSGLAPQGRLAGDVVLPDIGKDYSAAVVAVPFIASSKSEIGSATGSESYVSNLAKTYEGAPAAAEASAAPDAAPTKPASSSGGFLAGLFGGKSSAAPSQSTASSTQSPSASATKNEQTSDDPGHIQLGELSVKKNSENSAHFSLTYKFDSGKPNSSVMYIVHLKSGVARSPEVKKVFNGVDLKPEGTLEGDITMRLPTQPYHATVFGAMNKSQSSGRLDISNVQISEIVSDPPGVAPGTSNKATTSKKKHEQSNTSLQTKADVGVGAAGKDYGNGDAGLVTTPVSAYFSAREMIVFKIKLPHAMQMFKALNDRNPKSQEEFDEQILKENGIDLPELPEGQKYVYDPEKGQLMVEHPKSIPAAR
jgi:hypothetical protein